MVAVPGPTFVRRDDRRRHGPDRAPAQRSRRRLRQAGGTALRINRRTPPDLVLPVKISFPSTLRRPRRSGLRRAIERHVRWIQVTYSWIGRNTQPLKATTVTSEPQAQRYR